MPKEDARRDWPAGIGRVIAGEVGSTLDAARHLAMAPPFWFLAHRQTAARGRRGRAWAMPEGNFAATHVMQSDEAPGHLALRSFTMSLALHHALREVVGEGVDLALKWPNDVMLSGGKVAGILLESDGAGRLAIGVGVNLAAAPLASAVEAGALLPVSLFGETGVTVAPEDFLDILARHFDREETRFRAAGFGPLRDDWLARAAMRNRTITARLPKVSHVGRFVGLDDAGNLLLQTADGLQRIAAADIYF